MTDTMERTLIPALDLAAANTAAFPNESAAYRKARNALLAEEIELRRHAERVAAMRRALPPGGEVAKTYEFVGEDGPVTLEGLFGDKETLVVYSYMFGPEREAPCPMCTSFMAGFEEKVADMSQRVALAFMARSPIGRLVEAKEARGWTAMPVYSDPSGAFTARLRGRGGRRICRADGVLAAGRDDAALLERRDVGGHGRSRRGPARVSRRWTRCGCCSTRRRRGAGRSGIRSSATTERDASVPGCIRRAVAAEASTAD